MGRKKYGRIIHDLTEDEIKEIKWLARFTNLNDGEIAPYFDIGQSVVYYIRTGKRFTEIELPLERQPFFKVILPTRK